MLAAFNFSSFICTSSFIVLVYDGEVLPLTKVSRNEMGAYLCIATNGVPPSVSKRIILDVECKCLSVRVVKCSVMFKVIFKYLHAYAFMYIHMYCTCEQ